MKREEEIRELLIGNAIHLIGTGGFEKATTKEMTHCRGDLPDFKMNEIYIYRLFGNKEGLYEAAFACLDKELFYAFYEAAREVGGFGNGDEKRITAFLETSWKFILQNEERCRSYVRYYYSAYFKGSSAEGHRTRFASIVEAATPAFIEKADVSAILHSAFTTLLDFGIRVYNGDLEDSEINRPHIFKVVYNIMAPYFKEEA